MKQSCFDSSGNICELIAILTAISQVSARMAKNMTILICQAKEVKVNETNNRTHQHAECSECHNAKADRKNVIRVHQHI